MVQAEVRRAVQTLMKAAKVIEIPTDTEEIWKTFSPGDAPKKPDNGKTFEDGKYVLETTARRFARRVRLLCVEFFKFIIIRHDEK